MRGSPVLIAVFLSALFMGGCASQNPGIEDSLLNDALRWNATGANLQREGDYEGALDSYKKAEKAAQLMDALDIQAMVEHNLGSLYQQWGRLDLAFQAYSRAKALYEQQGDKLGVLREQIHLAGVLLDMRREGEAGPLIKEVIEGLEALGDNTLLSMAYGLMAKLEKAEGRAAQALTYLRKAVRLARKQGAEGMEAAHLCQMGRLLLQMGRHKEARRRLLRALELDKKNQNLRGIAFDLAYLTELEWSLHDKVSARWWGSRAVPLLQRFSINDLLIQVRDWMGGNAEASGP